MDTYSAIEEISQCLFEKFPLLESISWVQYVNEDDEFIVETDDFTINGESYWGENYIWKQDVSNYLRNAFDEIAPEDLKDLFGNDVQVTITRNDIFTDPYFVS